MLWGVWLRQSAAAGDRHVSHDKGRRSGEGEEPGVTKITRPLSGQQNGGVEQNRPDDELEQKDSLKKA